MPAPVPEYEKVLDAALKLNHVGSAAPVVNVALKLRPL